MPENLVNALKEMRSKAVKRHVRVVRDGIFLREDHFDFYERLYREEINRLNYRVKSSWKNILVNRGEIHYLLDPNLFWTGYVLSGDYNYGNLPRSKGVVLPARDRLFAGDVLFDGHKNLIVLGDLETTALINLDREYSLPKTTFETFLKIFRNNRDYENTSKREGLREFYRLFVDSVIVQTKDNYVLRSLVNGNIKWDFITKKDEIVGANNEFIGRTRRENVSVG